MRIRAKLSLLLTACITVPLVLGAGLSVFNARWALRRARVAALEAVVELKVTRIRSFFQEREVDITDLGKAPDIQDFLTRVSRLGIQPSGPESLALSSRLARRLRSVENGYPYADLMLVALDGKAVFCGRPRYEVCRAGTALPLGPKSLAASLKGVWHSDIDWEPSGRGPAPHMLLAAPVRDEAGRPLGVVAASLSMAPIFDLIGDNTGLGVTGETVVGRRTADGIVMLAPTRHDPGALDKTFSRREAGGSRAFPIERAVGQEPGSGLATDYRGRRVLAAWRYIPELDWGVVAKIDTDEAFAPVQRLMWLTLLLFALLLGVGALAAFVASESLVGPLRELERGAQAIGKGELDDPIAHSSDDELGQLADSFNRMARDLKESGAAVRRSEEAALRARAEWERTFDSVPDLIAVLDEQHRIRRVNKAMAERLGLKPEDCVGRACYELVHGSSDPPDSCPHSLTCVDGQEHFLEFHEELLGGDFLESTTPVFDARGKVSGSVHVARDITESKRAQAELREAARLRADLISLINHEYNNVLAIMKMALTLLQGSEPLTDEGRRQSFALLQKSVEKLQVYTSNFLDLHRIESGKFELALQPTSIRAVLLDDLLTLRPLAEAKQLRLSLQTAFPEDLPVAVRADPDCLSLIINNLVTNAVKYTPSGGAIRISVILEKEIPPQVRLSVEDTGIGMSPEDIGRVRSGFYRTEMGKLSAKGFGIGLVLVRQLLEKHGSRLEIESEPGKGSRFSFRLPVWSEAPQPVASRPT